MDQMNEEIKKYEKLARSLAKRYMTQNDYDDILQEARIGIWNGLRNYDSSSSTSLMTYLWTCGKFKINHYLTIKYAQKKCDYNSAYHEEKGTPITVSLDSGGRSTDAEESRSIHEEIGYEDRSLNNVFAECVLQDVLKALKKVFATDRATSQKKSQEMYKDYLKLSYCGVGCRTVPTLQKKYGVSRQRVHKVINRYNSRMKEELAGQYT